MALPPEDRSPPERSGLDPRNRTIRDLHQALVAFGREFGLLEGITCDCDNADCLNRSVETMTVERMLDWISDAWHNQAGCGHGSEDEADTDPAAREDLLTLRQRNLTLVAQFVAALRRIPAEARQVVEERYDRLSGLPLFSEADSLVAHGLDTAFPNWDEEPWALRALDAADEWAGSWSTPPAQAERVEQAVRAAVCGLLARGLASPELTRALYEPFALAVPLNELLASARRGLPAV